MKSFAQTIFAAGCGILVGTLILYLLFGCVEDRELCDGPGSMECRGDEPWLCLGSGEWVLEDDCAEQYTRDGELVTLTCCMVDNEAICMEDCNGY